jgi:hypothetical protein
MGLIREPLDVDFTVESRPLTKEEQNLISEFIKADKLKRQRLERRKITKKTARLRKQKV